MLVLNLIGPPRVTVAGRPQALRPRRLGLLAYLALEGPQPRARLAALLFPGLDSDEARARLRLELHRAVHSPLGAALGVGGEEVSLEADCDALHFRRDVAEGRWAAALARWRGELLEGLHLDGTPDWQAWLDARRAAFHGERTLALQGRLTQHEASGQPGAALDVQRQLLAHQPLSEGACDALTRRLAGLGQRAEALEEQERFRVRFRHELGLEPVLEHRLAAELPSPAPGSVPARPSLSEPPLVGREGLWQQLLDWRDHAPVGQALLLVGEGGVGKSRLAAALREVSGGDVSPTLRGSEAGQETPFSALLSALRQAGAARLAALEPRWQSELAGLLPDLFVPGLRPASASGGGAGAPGSEVRLLGAFAQALRLATSGARLTVLEDLHWLDASSVRALVQTEKRLRDDPGAPRLLATARPGELHANPPLTRWLGDLEREGRLVRLEVPPLSEVAVLRLIRQLSGSPRATVFARALHGLSGGNPYALLAFVQGLISRGHLDPGGPDGWTLHLDLAALPTQLPLTLRGVLLHRVETQGEAVLRVLEAAALRGLTFEGEVAAAGSGLPPDEARAALAQAVHHRWAVPLSGGLYRLEHDLLRRALEPPPDAPHTAAVHRRLAAALPGAAPPGERARHWQAAGEPGLALPLWTQAAQEAASLWAHREALGALEHALACTEDPARRLALYRQRGRHWQALGQLEAWRAELDVADALQRLADVPGEGLRLALERTHLLLREDRLEEALAHSAPWATGEMNEDRGLLLHDRGAILLELGRVQEAAAVLREALAGVSARSLLGANLHNTLAGVAYELHDHETGLHHAAQAIASFGHLGRNEGLVAAHVTQADLYALPGDLTAAHGALRHALRHALESQQFRLIHHTLHALTELMKSLGDGPSGLAYATQGLELAEAEGNAVSAAVFGAALEHFKAERTGTAK